MFQVKLNNYEMHSPTIELVTWYKQILCDFAKFPSQKSHGFVQKKGDTFGTTIFLLKVTILGYPSISQAMFQHIFHPRQLLQIYQKWWDAKEKYCWEIDYVNKKIRCLEGSAQRKAAALMFCWCWTCLQTVIYHDPTQNREMTIIPCALCAKWASKFWNPNRPPFHDLFWEKCGLVNLWRSMSIWMVFLDVTTTDMPIWVYFGYQSYWLWFKH